MTAGTDIRRRRSYGEPRPKEAKMYDRAMAQGRIDDLVHAAEAHRRAKEARAARVGQRRWTVARVKSAVLSAVLWPVRH